MTGGQPAGHAYRCPVCGHRDEVEHASSIDARAQAADPPAHTGEAPHDR